MKKFAATVLVGAMAMFGSVQAASASEDTGDLDILCVAEAEPPFIGEAEPPFIGEVELIDAYLVVERDYAETLFRENGKVCSGFSVDRKFGTNSQHFDFTFADTCNEKSVKISTAPGDTNAEVCSKAPLVIESTDIGGRCITSMGLVGLCGRIDSPRMEFAP